MGCWQRHYRRSWSMVHALCRSLLWVAIDYAHWQPITGGCCFLRMATHPVGGRYVCAHYLPASDHPCRRPARRWSPPT
ncbi:hypothetical protein B296_00040518 [Ensete ventricosum]|uniref:Secreted protein n=1 Tax=Ensete ventricosum TaxID=4639 RepID=A0A426XKT8_ENSVE|nr:hypothetical protein B296_00040518 [Ensete ventricosum]